MSNAFWKALHSSRTTEAGHVPADAAAAALVDATVSVVGANLMASHLAVLDHDKPIVAKNKIEEWVARRDEAKGLAADDLMAMQEEIRRQHGGKAHLSADQLCNTMHFMIAWGSRRAAEIIGDRYKTI